jgi:hypothetical protein
MKVAFGSMSIEALVERFEQICLEQDQALLRDKTKNYNKLYDEMRAIRTELSTLHARGALVRLLGHENTQVRYQTAMATLAVAPAEARRVIEAISKTVQMPYAANARETLRNLDSGFLKPP